MIVVNDFPYIPNEEFLMIKQPRPGEIPNVVGIILTKKQADDLYQFLDGIREAL